MYLTALLFGAYIDYYRIFFGATQSVELFCTYKENTDLPEIPDEKQIDDFMASVHERIVRGEM